MRRRMLVAAGAAALVVSACGDHGARTRAADATRVPAGPGITLVRPRGWHLATTHLTALSSPVDRLLLTSYPARRGGNCGPDLAERALPAGGALVHLYEYRATAGGAGAGLKLADFPPRPAHFALRARDLGTYECWRVPSYLIRFRAAGRAFQLHVALGARTTAARRAQVLRALDSLRFAPLPPPARRGLVTATALERAIDLNPGDHAVAACRAATTSDRRTARSFARTRRLFVCAIALRGVPAETFDVQVLGNGCFVAERRRRGVADYGCVR